MFNAGVRRSTPLWSLLQANRTGKLQALLEKLRNDQQDMERSASDLQNLKVKFKAAMLTAHRTGELHKVAGDLAQEVERQADDFQRLKERALESLLRMKRAGKLEDLAEEIRCSSTSHCVTLPAEEGRSSLSAKQRALQSLLEMKRSGELQFLAEEMESAQRKFEAKAAQFREISARMRRGVVNAMRSGELERLVGEMTEVLETQAESIRTRVRKGLLRAHRRGELEDLRQ
ncbi:syj1, partial [Symbiodinium necroappetens]